LGGGAHAVAQLFEALRYKPEGREFDSRWCFIFFNIFLYFAPPCRPDGHPNRVTNTRCRIDTVNSPDDGHTVARNM
jgi:hypothetical protein